MTTLCQKNGISEKNINKKAFDLILAFDDVLSHGYRESVNIQQIEAFLEMDSADEKMHKKMQLIREAEAKEQAKKQQKEIAKRLAEQKKGNLPPSSMQSISSSDYSSGGYNP